LDSAIATATATAIATETPRLDPGAEFLRRLEQARSETARVAKLDDTAGNVRLGLFVAAVILGILAYRGNLGWPWPVLALVLFALLVSAHGRIMTRRRRAERVAAFHEKGIARVGGHWAGQGTTGARFLDEDHPYAADLDLFGPGSLFERLCSARTAGGEAVLARWLLHPAAPEEVASRHEAVVELRDKLDFREDLALLGDDVRADVRAESLAEWGASPRRAVPMAIRLAVLVLALFTVAALTGLLLELIAPWIAAVLIAVEAAVAYGFARRANRALEGVEDRSTELETLSGLLARIEHERFASPELRDLWSTLGTDAAGRTTSSASVRIARLASLVRWLEARHNVYFALFTSVLLWRTQIAFAVEAWREREGQSVPRWLEVAAHFEAYASLAGYAFENPADPFPDVVGDASGPFLEGEAVGHPLLPEATCVRNSLTLGGPGQGETRVLAISGSNMSGKSTFLRTVGINAVLAQAGAPVRALRFRLSPLAIAGTLRVHDSLQDGRSRFYAEILRLKRLVDMASESPPLFFLVDEVLHGTNSADRLEGAGAVIRALIEKGAIGLFTTHDLALAEVAGRIGPSVSNVHFADHVGEDGRLAFDYKMRPGVVRQSNALALMRAVGLDV